MTVVKGTLVDVAGDPLEGVVTIFATRARAAHAGGKVVVEACHRMVLDSHGGFSTPELDPGDCAIEVQGEGAFHRWKFTVPESGTVDLADIVGRQVVVTPAEISRAESAAASAEAHAVTAQTSSTAAAGSAGRAQEAAQQAAASATQAESSATAAKESARVATAAAQTATVSGEIVPLTSSLGKDFKADSIQVVRWGKMCVLTVTNAVYTPAADPKIYGNLLNYQALPEKLRPSVEVWGSLSGPSSPTDTARILIKPDGSAYMDSLLTSNRYSGSVVWVVS